jgi:predicted RNA binding protein YcfA (HicA-like mRNA interferase family)
MSKRDKLRRKLRQNPKGRTKQEIETLLGHFGFTLDRVSGSHHNFVVRIGDTTHRLTVPIHGQTVKTTYVKQVIEKIDELFPLEDADPNPEDGQDE